MTNSHFKFGSYVVAASILLSGACATMDTDGARVETLEAGNSYGEYIPPPPRDAQNYPLNAYHAIKAMGPAFGRCYEVAFQDDSRTNGSARLITKIGPSGQVVSVTPTNVVGLPANMLVCLILRVKSAEFKLPKSEETTIIIPVTFEIAKRR